MTTTSSQTVLVAARTDPGKKRVLNEDAVAVIDGAQAGLSVDTAFIVADGMGGMQMGDVASGEAVRVVRETLESALTRPDADPRSALAEAFRRANDAVFALAQNAVAALPTHDAPTAPRPEAGQRGVDTPGLMGTTCIAGVMRGHTLHLAHVGDSRAYLLRDGSLRRLTDDHSFVGERVRAGDLTEEEARRSRFRNMITRAVGIDAQVEPEIRQERLSEGDTLLVCTDGLTTMLTDDEIEAILVRHHERQSNLPQMAGALVDAANKRGGSDNITVVLVYANGTGAPGSSAPVRAPGGSGGGGPSANVVEGSKPRSKQPPLPRPARRAASPFLVFLALLGVLALALAGALAFSQPLRTQAVRLLTRTAATPAKASAAAPVPDLTKVRYSPPRRFVPFLARGGFLAYSPRGFLVCVGETSGKVVRVSRRGEVQERSVATLPDAPPVATPIPASYLFMATDVQGNVYISHTARRVIEKYNAQGQLLVTLKGFQRPEAIAVDENGSIYVVDHNDVKFLRARRVTGRAAGSSGGGGAGS